MGFLDFLADAIDGAMTGKGNSFGAQLGKAFRAGYNSGNNYEEDPSANMGWYDFCRYWAERRGYYCVDCYVEHERGYDECRLISVFLDDNERKIDERFWIVPYDKKMEKDLNGVRFYPNDFLG